MENSHYDIMKLDAIFSTLAKILHWENFQSVSKTAWSVKNFQIPNDPLHTLISFTKCILEYVQNDAHHIVSREFVFS